MGRKVTIVGAGNVGASIAFAMTLKGTATEIVLVDINRDKASGEAMDIQQGTPFCPPVIVSSGDYSDAQGSDVVVITSGIPRKKDQSRIDLAQTNIDMIQEVTPQIVKYAPDSIYVIVSNPVDVLTYAFLKKSGLPSSQVFGTGTLLDTARLRTRLSDFFSLSQKNIHAYVLGEHGDSSFIPWSCAEVSGVKLSAYERRFVYDGLEGHTMDRDAIYDYIKQSGADIISNKGATFYAIASSTSHVVSCLFNSINSAVTVSSLIEGEYGVSDVCMSLPFILGTKGVVGYAALDLTDEESTKFRHSANTLNEVLHQTGLKG